MVIQKIICRVPEGAEKLLNFKVSGGRQFVDVGIGPPMKKFVKPSLPGKYP